MRFTSIHLKSFLFCTLFIGACSSSNSQSKESTSPAATESTAKVDAAANVLKFGETLAKNILKKDFKAVTAFTYKPYLDMNGGVETRNPFTIEKYNKEDFGDTLRNITYTNCSKIIDSANLLQCTMLETAVYKNPDGNRNVKNTLIFLSSDKGLTWSFVDPEGHDISSMQIFVSGLSSQLVLPQDQE